MRQQTRIPIANGFRNLRIQKQEKHHMRKTPTEEETVALGNTQSVSNMTVYFISPPPSPPSWSLSVGPDCTNRGSPPCPKCVDVCDLGHNANNPMSKNNSDLCIKGGYVGDYYPKSGPIWQSQQIGNIATWYYRNGGYFFDKWNSDSSPPTSCFCTAPKALSTSSSISISAKAGTFPDQYYYKDDNGSLISFYMSFDGTYVNIFLSNGNVSVTNKNDLPKTIQFGDYNIRITAPPSSSSPITYTVTNA